jgi:hypothetical protein
MHTGSNGASHDLCRSWEYDFLSCEQLIMQRKLWGEREVELRLLMDKGGAKRRRRSCERRRLPS